MSKTTWYEWEGSKLDLPAGVFWVAGHLKDDPEYVFTTLMYSDDTFKTFSIDPEFYQNNKPEDVEITYVADYAPAKHPEGEYSSTNDSDIVSGLLDEANEFLMSNKYTAADCERAVELLESIVDMIDGDY